MLSEIEIMAQLNHPNVVNFKEIFDTPNGYYVVMELYVLAACVVFRITKAHQSLTLPTVSLVVSCLIVSSSYITTQKKMHRRLSEKHYLVFSICITKESSTVT